MYQLLQKIMILLKGAIRVPIAQKKVSRGNGGKSQRDTIQRWWWN